MSNDWISRDESSPLGTVMVPSSGNGVYQQVEPLVRCCWYQQNGELEIRLSKKTYLKIPFQRRRLGPNKSQRRAWRQRFDPGVTESANPLD